MTCPVISKYLPGNQFNASLRYELRYFNYKDPVYKPLTYALFNLSHVYCIYGTGIVCIAQQPRLDYIT